MVVRYAVRDLIEAGLNESAGPGAYGFCASGAELEGSPTGLTTALTGLG